MTESALGRIYISGPISGLPDNNRRAFDIMAAELRGRGCDVFSPVENGLPSDAPWSDHMRRDIKALMDCQSICMIAGWSKSKGARLEFDIARRIGMEVIFWAEQ